MQFLYFIPNVIKADEVTGEFLASIGLGHITVKDVKIGVEITKGPNGTAGAIVGYPTDNKKLTYDESAQTWQIGPVAEDKVLWSVGYWNDSKPVAATLQRYRVARGTQIVFNEGDAFRVPLVRSLTRPWLTPRLMVMDTESKFVVKMQPDGKLNVADKQVAIKAIDDPKLKSAYDAADRSIAILQNALSNPDATSIPWEDGMQIVADALSCQYRVSIFELLLMQTVREDHINEVMTILTDWNDLVDRIANQVAQAGQLTPEIIDSAKQSAKEEKAAADQADKDKPFQSTGGFLKARVS